MLRFVEAQFLLNIAFTVAAVILTSSVYGQINPNVETGEAIDALVMEVTSEPDNTRRVTQAGILYAFVRDLERPAIGELGANTIESISALLDDDTGAVRGFAAQSLGVIGPAAIQAIPMLHEALLRQLNEEPRGEPIDQIIGRPTSGDKICEAFAKIGSNPEPEVCEDGLYYPGRYDPSQN